MSITVYNQGEIVSEVVPTRLPGAEDAIRGLMAKLDIKTQHKYGQTINDFLHFVSENPGPLSVVFSDYLGYLLNEKGLSESTVNGKRVAVRRFYEWAARVGYIDHTEYMKIKEVEGIPSSGGKRGRWLTKEQLDCVLAGPDVTTVIGRRDKAVLALLIGCATRRDETAKLTWDQLVKSGDTWIFENVSRKHHRTQEAIAVPDWVMEVLKDYYPGSHEKGDKVLVSYDRWGHQRGSMTAQAIYNVVKKYSVACGFEVSPHDLRRSWAKLVKESGLDIEQIQLMLGHASIETTQRYMNTALDVAAVAKALTF